MQAEGWADKVTTRSNNGNVMRTEGQGSLSRLAGRPAGDGPGLVVCGVEIAVVSGWGISQFGPQRGREGRLGCGTCVW